MTIPQRFLSSRFIVLGLAVIVVVAAVLYALLPRTPVATEQYAEGEFTRSAWQAAGEGEEDIHRTAMVDDLLEKVTFEGKTRKQVEAILGDTADTEKFSDWDMVYYLGPERHPFGIDSEWLVFRLDAEGTVSAHAVVTD